MDTSIIKVDKTNHDVGIKIGADDSKLKLIEFMNVRCPYSKKWFEESDEILAKYVAEGKVQRIIKLFDKEKPGLKRGNIMHQYIPYDNPKEAYHALVRIYETQHDWGDLEFEEVANYAETTLQLKKNAENDVNSQIISEANEANIQFVPTIICGKDIFDENITSEELVVLIEKNLNS